MWEEWKLLEHQIPNWQTGIAINHFFWAEKLPEESFLAKNWIHHHPKKKQSSQDGFWVFDLLACRCLACYVDVISKVSKNKVILMIDSNSLK